MYVCFRVNLVKMCQLMNTLDVSIDRHNYSLALTEVLEISKIHTQCKGR